MEKKVKSKKQEKIDLAKKYNLRKAIKNNPLYQQGQDRSQKAVKMIEESSTGLTKNKLLPGQLILFSYKTPKTKEQLDYYDANPCTIFFGLVNTSKGKRYLGFNIHYYPPNIRFNIMHKIYEAWKGVLATNFERGSKNQVSGFDYNALIASLKYNKLDFGLRMYIPELCYRPYLVAPKMWEIAVFTEGNFMKKTQEQIMKYWKKYKGK